LADFGISKQIPLLETFCGSPTYAAPEIWDISLNPKKPKQYTNAVDIWSLGVVGFEFVHDLPQRGHPRDSRGPRWCKIIAKAAVDMIYSQPDEPLFHLLSKMLQIDHRKRPSAADCLEESLKLNLDDIDLSDSSSVALTEVATGVQSEASMIRQLIDGEGNLNSANEDDILVAAPVLLQERQVVGSATLMRAVENIEESDISRSQSVTLPREAHEAGNEISLQHKRSWSSARSLGDKPSNTERAKRLRGGCSRPVPSCSLEAERV
jgi:serine/threonine protein kinase